MVSKPRYTSPENIQRGMDQYLASYSLKLKTHDYCVKGRAPRRAGLPRTYIILNYIQAGAETDP